MVAEIEVDIERVDPGFRKRGMGTKRAGGIGGSGLKMYNSWREGAAEGNGKGMGTSWA